MSNEGSSPEEKWPGVPFAYDFVLPSYEWMLTRLEAIDGRIQGIQTFAATFTLGMPLIGKSVIEGIRFTSPWFLLALATFALIVVWSVAIRSYGHLHLVNPAIIYEDKLHYSEWQFKRSLLHWAGEHFTKNTKVINRKGHAGNWLSGLFLLEVALFLIWIVTPTN